METLWQPFLSGDPPLVIYSNDLFVRDSDNGLKLVRSEEIASPHQVLREDDAQLTGTRIANRTSSYIKQNSRRRAEAWKC